MDYKTSTVIIYLSIHIKLSNCDIVADTMLLKRLIDRLWSDRITLDLCFQGHRGFPPGTNVCSLKQNFTKHLLFFFKSKMAVTLNCDFLCSHYIPRRLHQQDSVHAPRREITGWLLQGLAPSRVLQVDVWLSLLSDFWVVYVTVDVDLTGTSGSSLTARSSC